MEFPRIEPILLGLLSSQIYFEVKDSLRGFVNVCSDIHQISLFYQILYSVVFFKMRTAFSLVVLRSFMNFEKPIVLSFGLSNENFLFLHNYLEACMTVRIHAA